MQQLYRVLSIKPLLWSFVTQTLRTHACTYTKHKHTYIHNTFGWAIEWSHSSWCGRRHCCCCCCFRSVSTAAKWPKRKAISDIHTYSHSHTCVWRIHGVNKYIWTELCSNMNNTQYHITSFRSANKRRHWYEKFERWMFLIYRRKK